MEESALTGPYIFESDLTVSLARVSDSLCDLMQQSLLDAISLPVGPNGRFG
jgi:hypothetical protein